MELIKSSYTVCALCERLPHNSANSAARETKLKVRTNSQNHVRYNSILDESTTETKAAKIEVA